MKTKSSGAMGYVPAAWTALSLLGGMSGAGAQVQEPASPVTELSEILTAPVPEREKPLHALVLGPARAKEGDGAWAAIAGRTVVYLHRDQVAARVLEKNLLLRVTEDDYRQAQQALLEAQAVFYPVFDVTVQLDRSETHDRTVRGTVIERVFAPVTPQDLAVIPVAGPSVTRLGFRQQVAQNKRTTKDIDVSMASPLGPGERLTYTVGVEQRLPWGGSVRVAVATSDQETVYDRAGHSYGADWSSTLSVTGDSALPGMAGFGDHSPENTAIAIRTAQQSRAFWTVKAAVNDLLAAADAAFWTVVLRLEELAVAQEHLDLVNEQVQRGQRLFEAGRVTAYGKALIDAEADRARGALETARSRFVAASEALGLLLEDDPEQFAQRLYLPYGYSALLQTRQSYDRNSVLEVALNNRPELRMRAFEQQERRAELAFAEGQTRRDLRFTYALENAQNGSVYGYKSPGDSLGKLFDPDLRTYSLGLVYQYPWRNQAAMARRDQAEAFARQSRFDERLTKNDVRRAVADAVAGLEAAREQSSLAQRRFQFADDAYQRLAKRRDEGSRVRDNELIEALLTRLRARQAVTRAAVAAKQAETALFAAQGLLPARHAVHDGQSRLERRRIAVLQQTGRVIYFR